jgi:hypothetical protein
MSKQDVLWLKSMAICSKYCRCHQKPERSFFYQGYQLPLCARCTGILAGYIVGMFSAPFIRRDLRLFWLCLPLLMDGGWQYISSYESNNRKRFITGVLYGFALIPGGVAILERLVCGR